MSIQVGDFVGIFLSSLPVPDSGVVTRIHANGVDYDVKRDSNSEIQMFNANELQQFEEGRLKHRLVSNGFITICNGSIDSNDVRVIDVRIYHMNGGSVGGRIDAYTVRNGEIVD